MKNTKDIRAILVPYDYSETSKRGLENAVRFAKRTGARIVMLHVITIQGAYDGMYVPEQLWSKEVISQHHHAMEELGKSLGMSDPDLTTSVVIHPSASEAIMQEARGIGADLIVMGTHARHGVAHFFLGSTAERVVRHAACPVMTVGPTPQVEPKAA